MGIVRLALRRPYTVIVMGLLIAVLGILSVLTMSTDIFPDINVPVISVVWTDVGIIAALKKPSVCSDKSKIISIM